MEVWKWKYIATTEILANNTVYIKTIILWNTTTATSAVFYNEKTAATTNMFLTLFVGAADTKIIMFDDPCQLDTGCYITLTAETGRGLLVQYKPV